jgi:hypothetical protein
MGSTPCATQEASAISDRSPQLWGRTPSRSDPPLPFIGLISPILTLVRGLQGAKWQRARRPHAAPAVDAR